MTELKWHHLLVLFAILLAVRCASSSRLNPDSQFAVLRYHLSAIAGRDELKAFDRAAATGADSVWSFMRGFWSRHDPTPGTAVNEFRERFESRIEDFEMEFGRLVNRLHDDRIIAYLRYGRPSEMDTHHQPHLEEHLGWIYYPDPEVTLAGFDHRLLDKLQYAATFKKSRKGYFILMSTASYPWDRLLPRLSGAEIAELESILQNRLSDRYLKAAAAWRLRADPGVEAFAALLRSAGIVDVYVRSVIAGAVEPLPLEDLVPVETRQDSTQRIDIAEIEEDLPVRVPGINELIPEETPLEDLDPSRIANLVTWVYDPRFELSPEAFQRLRNEAAGSDSLVQSMRLWSDEPAEERYGGALNTAWNLLARGEHELAHDLLDPLLKQELLTDPDAWHLDAIALLELPSPGARQMAEERVRQAIRLAPGSVRFRLSLALILLRRTFTNYADGTLDRILEEVPSAADAYALKGRIRLEAFWALGWYAGGWGTPISERGMEPEVALSEALGFLNRALAVDPHNDLATWWLGLHYLLSEEWIKAAQVMNYMVREDTHRAEALLGRGMALQQLGMMNAASRDYQAGFNLLPPEARALASDPRWVVRPSEGGILDQRDVEALETVPADTSEVQSGAGRFWRAKDPLFTTEVNERLLEQYRRFAYVTWMFAIENLGLRGWETLKGRIYLRYGEPENMGSQRRAVQGKMRGRLGGGGGEGMDVLASTRGAAAAAMEPKEFWRYEGFTIAFGGGMTTGNMTLGPAPSVPGGPEYIDTWRELTELVELQPESSIVEGGREIVAFEATWYRFEDPLGGIELVPVVEFPYLSTADSESRFRATEYPLHLFVLDDNWEVMNSQEWTARITMAASLRVRTVVGPVVSLPADTADSRVAFTGVEYIPADESTAYASRDTLDAWTPGQPRISSIVVSTQVADSSDARIWPSGSYISRAGMAMRPRPTGRFVLNEPIYLYFEVYGLSRDEYGATQYQLEMSVSSMEERRDISPVLEVPLARLLQRSEERGRVTLLFEREGIRTRTQEYLRMVFPTGEIADLYAVTIGVRDLVSGARTERTIPVKIGG